MQTNQNQPKPQATTKKEWVLVRCPDCDNGVIRVGRFGGKICTRCQGTGRVNG